MPSLAQAFAAKDINTFDFDTKFSEFPLRRRVTWNEVPTSTTGEEGLSEDDEDPVLLGVQNLSVKVDQKNLKFTIRVVAEEYQGQETENYFLASWVEDSSFVAPGFNQREAIKELTSFLVDTILHLDETPDNRLAPSALKTKRTFRSMLGRR